ncbi:MAG: YggS family pyridoxal phosphate-dependent enzyme [Bacteroidetes bacterium]|nr:YggS family pyridoxal phosphate-dependent enzyme [Bacteroidota bacterium]
MIGENILKIKQEIGQKAEFVIVSKTRSIPEIEEAYQTGHKSFAENRVQYLLERYEVLPKDIQWHLIGHLQTNKVKYIAPFIHLIQSVDSLKLLEEINNQAIKNNRVINCLLQIFIAQEETKFGLSEAECIELLNSAIFKSFKNINICGLMGMASFTENKAQVEAEFKSLKSFFDQLKSKYQFQDFEILSMGMSGDYLLAIDCGSNMVRVGSKVFS